MAGVTINEKPVRSHPNTMVYINIPAHTGMVSELAYMAIPPPMASKTTAIPPKYEKRRQKKLNLKVCDSFTHSPLLFILLEVEQRSYRLFAFICVGLLNGFLSRGIVL